MPRRFAFPPLPSRAALVLASSAGLLVSAWAAAARQPLPGFLGLALAFMACLGLWLDPALTRRELRRREDLLRELNLSLDEQVRARTLRLMQTIEDLESFNRMITHDLRSPLSSLMAGLDLVQMETGRDNPRLSAHLDLLCASVNRMRELIEGLQELCLISGRLPEVQEVDISHHAQLVLLNLQQKEPGREVRWVIEPGLSVLGDPNLVRIGLENLLGNAWKYTMSRHPAEITVRRGQGPGTVIEIQDNGIGFDMAKVDALFQPFKRLHSDPRIPGHGIGLSIVKRVMTKHGGKVSAQGAPGEGATFRLEFLDEPGGR